jgi:hypothetical protein
MSKRPERIVFGKPLGGAAGFKARSIVPKRIIDTEEPAEEIKYPISFGYNAEWDFPMALREVLQNAFDAVPEDKPTVLLEGNSVIVADKGSGFQRKDFLIGEGEKSIGDRFSIGKFHRGMKQAMLVFARSGYTPVIHTRDFIAQVYPDEMYGSKTFKVHITKCKDFVNGTVWWIKGVSNDDIDRARWFLKGDVLYDPKVRFKDAVFENRPTQIFYKGLFVASAPTAFGFNIASVDVRDSDNPKVYDREKLKDAVWSILIRNPSDRVYQKIWEANEESAVSMLEYPMFSLEEFTAAELARFSRGFRKWLLKERGISKENAKRAILLPSFLFHKERDVEYKHYIPIKCRSDDLYRLLTERTRMKNGRRVGSFKAAGEVLEKHASLFKFVKPSKEHSETIKRTVSFLRYLGLDINEKIRVIRFSGDPGEEGFNGERRTDERGVSYILLNEKVLNDVPSLAGTLAHEELHGVSGARDLTAIFQHELTQFIGELADLMLRKNYVVKSQIKKIRETIDGLDSFVDALKKPIKSANDRKLLAKLARNGIRAVDERLSALEKSMWTYRRKKIKVIR